MNIRRALTTQIALAALMWVSPSILAPGIGHLAARVVTHTPADSLAIRRNAEMMIRLFLAQWRAAWFRSDSARQRSHFYDRTLGNRNAHLHCHATYGPPRSDEEAYVILPDYTPIRSAINAQARCPSWILGPTGTMADEANVIDGALLPGPQEQVREERQWLIAELDSARRALPGDAWLAGQHVRFLVDAGRGDDALASTRACSMDPWWCAALVGYVEYQRHAIAAADTHFAAATAALTPARGCDWTDIRQLLPRESKEDQGAYDGYVAMNCTERAQVEARYWWLADPLLSVAPNERRAAHFARKVLLALHAALEQDERNRWGREFGGDATADMFIRYGWPSVAVRLGAEEDRNHDSYLKSRGARASAPYSTAEYSAERYHFAAAWWAVMDPFHAADTAWTLTAPSGRRTQQPGLEAVWWPIEHLRYDAEVLVQLPAGQVALFRRQQMVYLANAISLTGPAASVLEPLNGESVTLNLVSSDAPDSVERVAQFTGPLGQRIVLHGLLRSRSVLVGIETTGNATHHIIARSRFGLTPPPALADLPPGTVAVSDPVFFTPTPNGEPPADVAAMVPHMLGSTNVPRGSKVGVFWESYGVPAGDSVHIAISVTPESGPGLLRRLGAALRIVDASMTGIAVAWQDPQQRNEPGIARNLVPILPRSVVLGLSELQKGSYQIEVVVTTPGREAARAHRSLTIQ